MSLPRRLIILSLAFAAIAFPAGCASTSSPTAQAWERAAATARANNDPFLPGQFMAASDGLGRSVAAAEQLDRVERTRATFANVPTE